MWPIPAWLPTIPIGFGGGLISAYFAEIPHLLHKGATIPHLLMTTTRLFYACDIEIRYHNLSNHTHNTKRQQIELIAYISEAHMSELDWLLDKY